MRKRLLCLILLLCLAAPAFSESTLSFTVVPEVLRPGKAERIAFIAPREGSATVALLKDGASVYALRSGVSALAGINNLVWDGCDAQGAPFAPGEYALAVDLDGER